MNVFDVKRIYEDGSPMLRVVAPDDDGKTVETVEPPVDPYCYVRRDDLVHDDAVMHGLEIAGATDEHVRLEADDPENVRDFADFVLYDTYESDVGLAERCMIDTDWGVARPDGSDVLYFDIEVDSSEGFPAPQHARQEILSIAGVDGNGEEVYFDDADEGDLVRSFLEAADDYAVLVGWNALDFDYRYLENRSRKIGINVNWDRWARHDMQPLYDMLAVPTKTVSLSLDDVAERELDEGKTEDISDDREALARWKEEDPDRLRGYNMNDCHLLRRLDEIYGVVDLLHVVCDICNYPPGDACYLGKGDMPRLGVGNVADAKVLEVADERGVPMPDKGGDTGDFPGADVLDPKPGLYDGVATVDYSGMYPNIIRAFNFGPTTWYPDEDALREDHPDADPIRAESGVFVDHNTRKSIPAEAADELVEMREGAPDVVDKGVKVVNNTLYGIFASGYHRYYVEGMSENITLLGQRLVRLAEDAAGDCEVTREVVYGDTDSVMVHLDVDGGYVDAAEDAADAIESELQRWAAEGRNARGKYLELDVDDVYDRFYVGDRKKRYFGRAIDGEEPEFKVKGYETRQNSWPEPVREFQRELMHRVIDDEPIGDLIEETKEGLYAGDLDEGLAMSKSLGKDPEDYEADTPPIHARAAMGIREEFGEGEVSSGDRVSYIKYGPDTEDYTWVHNGEIGLDGGLRPWDYEFIWEHRFEAAMESIDVSELNQRTLGEFA